jgi:hypothetical protein
MKAWENFGFNIIDKKTLEEESSKSKPILYVKQLDPVIFYM